MLLNKKINNRGFSHIELFLLVIVVLSVAGFGIYDAHRHFTHADQLSGSYSSDTATTAVLFRNPFRDIRGLDPWRIDEGVDYRGVGSGPSLLDGPIYAVGPGVVTDVHIASKGFANCAPMCESHFWADDGGNDVIYRITKGLATNEYIYVAEDCVPTVTIGQALTDTTKICNMFGPDKYTAGYYGIETGEWNGPKDNGSPTSVPLAKLYNQYVPSYADGTETHYGYNMNERLVAVGAPSGNTTTKHPHAPPYVSNDPGHPVGSVPANWPNKWQADE